MFVTELEEFTYYVQKDAYFEDDAKEIIYDIASAASVIMKTHFLQKSLRIL